MVRRRQDVRILVWILKHLGGRGENPTFQHGVEKREGFHAARKFHRERSDVPIAEPLSGRHDKQTDCYG